MSEYPYVCPIVSTATISTAEPFRSQHTFCSCRKNLRENIAKSAANLFTNRSAQSTCSSKTCNFNGSWRKDGTESPESTGTSVAGSVACRLGGKLTFLQFGTGEHRRDLVHERKHIRVDVRRSFRCGCRYSKCDCGEDENEVRCDLHFV